MLHLKYLLRGLFRRVRLHPLRSRGRREHHHQPHRSRFHLHRVFVERSETNVVERIRKRSGDTELYDYAFGCIEEAEVRTRRGRRAGASWSRATMLRRTYHRIRGVWELLRWA
jgi:hypothetical protein